MTRPRALTSTFKSVIALLTALLISVVGATALPAAALAGNSGHAKGQADRAEKPGKAHQQDKAQQSKAPRASKSQSNGKAQERGSSAKAQEPAKAEKTQPARGHSAQAQQSKTGSGSSASKSGDTSGDKGDPAGNNGTVKLAGFGGTNGPGHSSGTGSTPKHPSNDPHLPCGFSVEWFGFDSGVISDVTFEQHAPTRGGKAHYDEVQLDDDSHSGGGSTTGYDGVANYNLDFEGEPHAKHGYHVKLTTETPYSQGSDTKHKVFWVESCEAETPDEETPDEETPDEETPDEETPDNPDNPVDNPDDNTPDDNDGVQDTVDENGGNTSTVVFGAQASVQSSQGTQASEQAAEQAAEVPTAVEAGLTGDGAGLTGDAWSRSVLPLLAVLFGFGTALVALARRRTRVQTITRD